MDRKVTIATHSSKFHSDDIFAVATLELILEKDGIHPEIIRTRDIEIIEKCDYVVDVGFIYDEKTNRFDHHQKEGAGARNNGIPYASFGLVWKKYGNILCGNLEVLERIDKQLVQPIDARDNGIDFIKTNFEDLFPFDIQSLLYVFRPTWKENDDVDEIFLQLVSYARVIVQRMIIVATDELEAENLVIQAYNNAIDKRLIILDERYPWKDVLGRFPEPLFVVYKKRVDETWSLKTISENIESYISRKELPETWAGRAYEDLEHVTGVKGAIFCHQRRFLAVAKSKEAILQLAQLALNE